MPAVFIGSGTVVNVLTILAGGALGTVAGHRLPTRTRDLVTQALGLFTLVMAADAIRSGLSPELSAAVGAQAPLLVVLGALLLGGIAGSLLRIEQRLDDAAEWLRRRLATGTEGSTFVEGAVTSTLVFCVGPLAVLGSLSDGLGTGAQQLYVKAVMDGFAAIAFASSFGVGVLVSVVPVALYQGAFTLAGFALGQGRPAAHLDALGATGGVILLGLGIRLAGIKAIPVGDLLPALAVAPLLVALLVAAR